MNAQATFQNRCVSRRSIFDNIDSRVLASDARYVVRMADGAEEVTSALRLRHQVFNRELRVPSEGDSQLDFDSFDRRSRHLIAVERSTNQIVGTYRVNSLLPAEQIDRLYSYAEFTIEDLPPEVLYRGVEIGRACIARGHRGSKALFIL